MTTAFGREPSIGNLAAAHIFLLGFLVASSLAALETAPAAHLAEGDSLYAAEQFKKAAKAYERAAQSSEHAFSALLGLARCDGALERWDEAAAGADRALAVAGTGEERATALNYRGVAQAGAARLLAEGKKARRNFGRRFELLQLAIDSYRQALAAVEEPPAAIWRNLAAAQSQAGQFQAARESVDEFLRLAPDGGASIAGLVSYIDCVDKTVVALNAKTVRSANDLEIEPPVRVHSPAPAIPDGVQRPIDGVATFEGVIDLEGALRCVLLVRNNGLPSAFIDGALRTLSGWRFEPARLKGEPVMVTYDLTVSVRTDF